jgi:hypothetical protein
MLDLSSDAGECGLILAQEAGSLRDDSFQTIGPGVLEEQQGNRGTIGHVLTDDIEVILGDPLVTVRCGEEAVLIGQDFRELPAGDPPGIVPTHNEEVQHADNLPLAQVIELGY